MNLTVDQVLCLHSWAFVIDLIERERKIWMLSFDTERDGLDDGCVKVNVRLLVTVKESTSFYFSKNVVVVVIDIIPDETRTKELPEKEV